MNDKIKKDPLEMEEKEEIAKVFIQENSNRE